MPRKKNSTLFPFRGKKNFKPRKLRITIEIEVADEEAFEDYSDPEMIAERLDDQFSTANIVEVVIKDLGEPEVKDD